MNHPEAVPLPQATTDSEQVLAGRAHSAGRVLVRQ